MRNIAPIGKKNFVGRKFKSAGANQLSASDKNFIKNNINKFINQQLSERLGKPVEVIEKFIKKEKLIRVVVEKPTEIGTENGTKERKTSNKSSRKIDFIKRNYKEYSAIELAKEYNCSVQTIRYHLKTLKLSPLKKPRINNRPTKPLSDNEVFIKENHQNYTTNELAEKLNTTVNNIRYYLRKLNLKSAKSSRAKDETPQVIKFLKANYRTMTAREMGKALNISWRSAKYLMEKHRIIRTPKEVKALKLTCGKIIFTPDEEKYIIAHHGEITLGEIAKNIQRTRSSVINFLARKGLKITKEQHNKLNKKNFELARMKAKTSEKI